MSTENTGVEAIFATGPLTVDNSIADAGVFPTAPEYQLSSGTIELVFTADTTAGVRYLMSMDSAGFDLGGHFGIFIEDGALSVFFQDASETFSTTIDDAVTAGQKTHVLVAFDDVSGYSVFLNGVLTATNGDYLGGLGGAEPIVIGASQEGSGDGVADVIQNPFDGTIVAARLFDEVADAAIAEELAAEALNGKSDFNGDGTDDVVWRNEDSGEVVVWELSDGGVEFSRAGNVSDDWRSEGVGDFNGDGVDDIAWRNESTNEVVLWEMGGGSIDFQRAGNAAAEWSVEGTGDFNADGTDDLVWRNGISGDVVVWQMDDGVPDFQRTGNAAAEWSMEGTGDFNGDGADDLVWRNTNTGDVVVWEMGDGPVSFKRLGSASQDWSVEGAGDFTGDGVSDLVWRNADTDQVVVWELGGSGPNFLRSGNAAQEWSVETTGDFNGDGIDDILWRNQTSGDVVSWEMNEGRPNFQRLGNAPLEWQAINEGDENSEDVQEPGAVDDTGYVVLLGESLTIPVAELLANDNFAGGGEPQILGANGALLSGDNIVFTPSAVGVATFTYTVQDASGFTSTATVTVNVPNRAPVAQNDDNDYETTVGDTLTIPVSELLANDSDADGEQLTVTAANGAVLNGANILFTPTEPGDASFTYTVEDPSGATAQATVFVSVPNRAPSASDDGGFEVFVGQTLTIPVSELLANDTDPDQETLQIVSVDGATLDGDNVVLTPTVPGATSFTYTIEDASGASSTATVSVNVPNRAPIAVDDTNFQTTLGQTVTIPIADLLANDSDPDGQELTIVGVNNGAQVVGDNIVFEPSQGGEVSFAYIVSDASGATDQATVTISTNQLPVGADDAITGALVGETLTIPVAQLLQNDGEPDGEELSIVSVDGATLDGSNVVFTPTAPGEATFTYTLEDESGGTDEATVTVTVDNRAPVAQDDSSFQTTVGQTLEIAASELLANDSDADGETLTITSVTGADVVLDGDIIRFSPSETGGASFTYTVQDPSGGSDQATVSVSVPNQAPVAGDDAFTATSGTPLTIPVFDLLSNDVDTDNQPLMITGVSGAGASLVGQNIVFTPSGSGPASFTYTVEDPQGASDVGTVDIDVNALPIAMDDGGYEGLVGEALTIPVSELLSNDSDPDGDDIMITEVSGATLDGANVVFTPTVPGAATFTYTIEDASGATATASVSVNVANRAPVATDDDNGYEVLVGQTLSIPIAELLANDSDPDNEVLTIASVDGATLNGANIDFAPTAPGAASFTYTVEDPSGASSTATVSVNVPNRAPIAQDDNDFQTSVGQTLSIAISELLSNDSDPDGEELTLTEVNGATINGQNIEFTPNATGQSSFTYTIEDESGATATATVTVDAPNQAPVAVDDGVYQGNVGQQLSISISELLSNDSDPDGEDLTIVNVDNGALISGGNVLFTPSQSGANSFTYTVEDESGGSDQATVTVVTPQSFAGSSRAVVADLEASESANASRILMIGDSITEGNSGNSFSVAGAWRPDLWDGLTVDQHVWVDFVGGRSNNPGATFHDPDHQGLNSLSLATVARPVNQIDPGAVGAGEFNIDNILSNTDFDVALIMLGSNDVINFAFNGNQFGADPNPNDMASVINALHNANPNGLILVQEIPTTGFNNSQGVDDDIAAFNAGLASVVNNAQGINVQLVPSPLTSDDIAGDGIHPTPAGHAKIANAWLAAIDANSNDNGGTVNGTASAISSGVEELIGSSFGDRLAGDGDANTLRGEGGDDWIEGRGGNDDLWGGSGRDQFVFGLNDGADTVHDFSTTDDLVYVVSSTPASFQVTQNGSNAVVTFGSTTVVLEDTIAGAVTVRQFDDDLV